MRDYKNSGRKKKAASHGTPGWKWMLTGLAAGLFIAGLIYLHQHRPQKPPVAVEPAPLPAPPKQPQQAKIRSSVPAPAARKPAAPEKPRYDFYTLLPEMEVVIPKQETQGGKPRPPAVIESPGIYMLQAGSFKSFQEADALKANIALIGVESRIETVTVDNQVTWYRVRLGPYTDLAQLNKVMARLRENNINAVLMKVKG